MGHSSNSLKSTIRMALGCHPSKISVQFDLVINS